MAHDVNIKSWTWGASSRYVDEDGIRNCCLTESVGVLASEGNKSLGDPPPSCIQEPSVVRDSDRRSQEDPLAVHCFCVCSGGASVLLWGLCLRLQFISVCLGRQEFRTWLSLRRIWQKKNSSWSDRSLSREFAWRSPFLISWHCPGCLVS